LEQLLKRARECEDKGLWVEACACYDQVLRGEHDPDEVEAVRRDYVLCLRHVHQLRRHRDPSFVKTILSRSLPEALDIYEKVLGGLQAAYLDRDRVQPSLLFQQGLLELRFALEDETFVEQYLAGVPPGRLRTFLDRLDLWSAAKVQDVRDARDLVREVGMTAAEMLALSPTVVALEFTCGACNGLDEYTFYLTPAQLQYLQAMLRGEAVGVGVKIGLVEQRL